LITAIGLHPLLKGLTGSNQSETTKPINRHSHFLQGGGVANNLVKQIQNKGWPLNFLQNQNMTMVSQNLRGTSDVVE
jgi:hypothetical protein